MPSHEGTTMVRVPNKLLDRIRPIVAYRMKNMLYSRIHTLSQEKEHSPNMTTIISEAIEFYLDICAPIETTPADRLVDPNDKLDFRFVPWCGNTPKPETREAFQDKLKAFISEVWKEYVPSEGYSPTRKKKKK